MRTPRLRFGVMLIALAAGLSACTPTADESAAAQSEPIAAASEPAAEPAVSTGQDSAVPYDSDTRGALQVMSLRENANHWFDVYQDGQRPFAGSPPLLNGTLALAPGTYDVDVNRTRRQVTIETGMKTIIWTGQLIVEGEPDGAFWYPMQGEERRVTSNPPTLNSPIDLFPGTYTVLVYASANNVPTNLGDAEVTAGQRTTLRH